MSPGDCPQPSPGRRRSPLRQRRGAPGQRPAFADPGRPAGNRGAQSKDRVRSALLNAGFDFPARRITLNLAPADLPKDGGRFDLAIALGILAASPASCPAPPSTAWSASANWPCPGRSAQCEAYCRPRWRRATQGAFWWYRGKCRRGQPGQRAYGVRRGPPAGDRRTPPAQAPAALPGPRPAPRALPLSRPGRGPGPGRRQARPCWWPPPARTTCCSAARRAPARPSWPAACPACCRRSTRTKPWRSRRSIRWPATSPSGTGRSDRSASRTTPPPRRPWSAAAAAAAGRDHPGAPGRAVPRRTAGVRAQGPGGPARAAGKRRDRHCRANGRVRFPARFQLVAAMNPCPCGYLGDPSGRCRCTPEQVQRYRGKLSRTAARSHRPARQRAPRKHQPAARTRRNRYRRGQRTVGAARQRQLARQGCANAHLDLQAMHRNCALAEADRRWLEAAGERLELSLRALHRILKVARTLADLERIDAIERRHLAEALQYRAMTST